MAKALNQFLKSVQSKAYAQAKHAVKNREEALDIVQDSMLKLAKRYARRDADEWPLLFQRILQNQIRDWYRRQKVRRIILWWDQSQTAEEEDEAPLAQVKGVERSPEDLVDGGQVLAQLGAAIEALPPRQQQVFLLRALWGHDTNETANILGCHTGTVKTHYARSLKALRTQLEAEPC